MLRLSERAWRLTTLRRFSRSTRESGKSFLTVPPPNMPSGSIWWFVPTDQARTVAGDLGVLGENLAKLNDDIAKLQAKLQDAKARQRTIVLRAQNAQTSLKARTHIHSAKIDDMLNRFDYAERRIDAVEAQAEALGLGRAKSLNQAFADLESEERIKSDLEALKARIQQPKG